ncbi:outer membrane beta-barrel protein [Yeosuana sp.]|uniref:outer membrane beta-barrel protein n=1 Tax=Yeosuana sp. TaxID=2529388 RepID=UPI004054FD45|tara:strand:+ start:3578 stop:4222 length:645 start_codon:yes stop_codon:yes gene_type:complete
MTLNFKSYKHIYLAIIFAGYCFSGFSQVDTSTLKAQIALGVNSPSSDGFVGNFESKSINFPTINLGIQYMVSPTFGAKLDFGYNRFSNLNDTPEFKVNYSRINAQLVYNATRVFGFLPNNMGVFMHAGPGLSFIKPLGNYPDNKTSYLNLMYGMEFHFGISDSLSWYIDGSYISGFSDDFNPVSDGFGSFNGNLLNVSVGVSMSLTGCYFCGND